MSDAERIWREGEGQSKQKTVRAIWPALAAALDGASAAGPADAAQPICHGCTTRLAIGRAADIPVCGRCAGVDPFRSLRLSRVSGWRAGPVPR